MSFDVVRLAPDELDEWNDVLERSPHATPFHLAECLQTLDAHSSGRLHPLVAYKGDHPVGLYPVFEQRKGPLTLVTSPPPDQHVDYLGPALVDTAQLKRRRLDKRNLRFFEACLDWFDTELRPDYINLRTGFDYADPRPFDWNGFDVTTKYTYLLDLSAGRDELFAGFSADARRKVRAVRDVDSDVVVELGGRADARRILEQLGARLEERGASLRVSTAFVTDLYDRLPDGVIRPYVCRVDGEFAGGLLTVESHGTAYAWQGGAKTEGDLDLNDYIDWRVICDAVDRGVERYDLVGAETKRLCWYKSKFGPDLRPYHVAERSSRAVGALANLYRRLR